MPFHYHHYSIFLAQCPSWLPPQQMLAYLQHCIMSSTHRRCGVWQLYSALVARFRWMLLHQCHHWNNWAKLTSSPSNLVELRKKFPTTNWIFQKSQGVIEGSLGTGKFWCVHNMELCKSDLIIMWGFVWSNLGSLVLFQCHCFFDAVNNLPM